MKKILIIIGCVFLLLACSVEDDSANIAQDLAPVLSVEMPNPLLHGQSNKIIITYKKPSSCHSFTGFDISSNNNQFVVGVVTSYRSNRTDCSTSGNLEATAELNFVAEREDFYIFKFWQGINANGENRFLRMEIPVTRPGN